MKRTVYLQMTLFVDFIYIYIFLFFFLHDMARTVFFFLSFFLPFLLPPPPPPPQPPHPPVASLSLSLPSRFFPSGHNSLILCWNKKVHLLPRQILLDWHFSLIHFCCCSLFYSLTLSYWILSGHFFFFFRKQLSRFLFLVLSWPWMVDRTLKSNY